MAVHLGGDLRVRVPWDPLDSGPFAPRCMSRLAVVWRRSWNRIGRTWGTGHRASPWTGQRRGALSGVAST
jgi:hypothetical protein